MSTPTILVVDDEPQIRRVMRTTLSSNGYTVLEARSRDGQQIRKCDSGRIEPVRVLVEVRDGQNRGQRGGISGEGRGQIFGHRPNLA